MRFLAPVCQPQTVCPSHVQRDFVRVPQIRLTIRVAPGFFERWLSEYMVYAKKRKRANIVTRFGSKN